MTSSSRRSDAAEAFTTHSNYLRAFALLAGCEYVLSEEVVEATVNRVTTANCLPTVEHTGTDLRQIKSSLANAWGTELLLALSGTYLQEDEVIRISNNWAVVQAYYVAYHATQALAVAKGYARPDSHPKTQKQYVSLWVGRNLVLEPWTLGLDAAGCRNVPRGIAIDLQIHSWRQCDQQTCWSLAAKALRTTRQEALKEALSRKRVEFQRQRRAAWRQAEENRLAAGRNPRREPDFPMPQLPAHVKSEVDHNLRAYGLIDYLYRLRIRSNYEDAAMFTDGPSDPFSSERVRDDLIHLACSTLLVHELHIRSLVGRQEFGRWVDDWLKANGTGSGKLGLALRRHILLR